MQTNGRHNATIADRLLSGVSFLSFAITLYFLSAPPVMGHYFKQNGRFPDAFAPAVRLIESHYNGPFLWYCNHVWGLEILLFGDEPSVTWGDIAIYSFVSAFLLAAILARILKQVRAQTRPA